MSDLEHTLTSPVSPPSGRSSPLLALTIVWHPDLGRVGEQSLLYAGDGVLEISRYLPLFRRVGCERAALGYGGISREPLRIIRGDGDSVEIVPSGGKMALELNGAILSGPTVLSREQVESGAMLFLGRAVLLCLHWMRCLPKDNPVDGMLGVGSATIRVRDLIRQMATSEAPVLLLGETGTGKEVAARALHALGPRAGRPLVVVNMAALNESLAAADLFGAAKGAYTGAQGNRNGLFSEAENGTLFLDEIGNTPAAVQPMLLRVLETRDYRPLGAARDQHANVRLIAATDQDLAAEGFNQPLLRRLESLVVQIPPLRARREDIGVLLVHLLQESRMPGVDWITLPAGLVAAFANYDWPGNVRQLGHVLKRALLLLQMGEEPEFGALVELRPRCPVGGTSVAGAGALAVAAGNSAAGAATPTVPLPSGAGVAAVADAVPPLAAAPRVRTRTNLAAVGLTEVLAAMERHYWHIQGAALELGVSRPSMYKLLAIHPEIRTVEQIGPDAIRAALAACGGDMDDCAARLKTPVEALRREARLMGLVA